MCLQCEAKDEMIAYLRSELGQVRDATTQHALAKRYGFRPREARLLSVLHHARGQVLDCYQLLEAIDSERADAALVKVMTCKIRQKLGKHAILTVWGRGFCIGPEGTTAVEKAIAWAQGTTTEEIAA